MSPFVGPSLISMPGRKGEVRVATPFATPAGQPLPNPYWLPGPFPAGYNSTSPVIPGTPAPTPVIPATPRFPSSPAMPSAYRYPWFEHPWPAPNVPGERFWPRHWLSFPRGRSSVDPLWVSGGNALPGSMLDAVYTSPTWPPTTFRVPMHLHPYLAPNPFATAPHFDWDLSCSPETARRITGRNCTVDITSAFKEPATYPPTGTMLIASDFILQESWGPIVAKSTKGVTFYDVLLAIYEYWQQQLTERDVAHLQRLDSQNYGLLVDAYHQRCRRSHSIRGWERSQGLRRVDLLGDNRKWWGKCSPRYRRMFLLISWPGLWLSYGGNGTWYANLGTISVPYRWE